MKAYTSWILMVVAVVIIIGGMIWYTSKPGMYDDFALCITESGATFYGAFWCPHCQEQKALFGKSAGKLPYTECSTPDGNSQNQLCKEKNIESYPTWEFKDGTRETGTLTFEKLAQFTGCPVPEKK